MAEPPRRSNDQQRTDERFPVDVGRKAARRRRAAREKDRGVWFSLGLFGLVGWSIAIPTLLGVALGVWIDTRWPGPVSWTLTLLFVGVVVGCLNAWYWVKQESGGS
jgi:ATP synthase protein I